jgi:hypothetical protein
MKLTVGPLPSAVYWRRRAAVAGTLFLLTVALIYSCSSNSNVSQRNRVKPSGSSSKTPTLSPSPSAPVLTPGGGIVAQTGEGDEPPPSAAPSAEPPAPLTGPCTDGEMAVTASPSQGSAPRNTHVRFYLRIKNISGRSCTRDLGADAQELYLQDASKARIWSSDACDPRHGADVRTFGPGIEAEFYLDWDGKASNAGCANRQPPPAGKYELVGRLATKLGDPAPVELK